MQCQVLAERELVQNAPAAALVDVEAGVVRAHKADGLDVLVIADKVDGWSGGAKEKKGVRGALGRERGKAGSEGVWDRGAEHTVVAAVDNVDRAVGEAGVLRQLGHEHGCSWNDAGEER